MNKKIIFAIVVTGLFLLGFMFWPEVKEKVGAGLKPAPTETGADHQKISHYTCPMHPQIHEEKPGNCPICQMKLVPVYQTSPASGTLSLDLPRAESRGKERDGERSVIISPERQQLIGIKTAKAVKKQVFKEILTSGRVAFDPELAIAQKEFVEINNNVPSLREAAISHLKILGMSDEEIRSLGKRNKVGSNLYLPEKGDSVWIYATLYENEMDLVKNGQLALITLPTGSDKTFKGTVRAIDPVVNPMTRSVRARIELPAAGGILKPETFVNVSLQIDLGEALVIPKSSIIDTGVRKVIFVVHEGTHFEKREIEIGPEAQENQVILSGLKEGEIVVTSATFLVDSESQLKASVETEGHRH
ncbi:MAG: efflux RND transporter periplasmic adaptor subunit [Deltaproteobacteria bacterium]|nr:efflux RND transporter periplasmic adaptor subunit [Deltaproteobacteria bacterium]